MNCNILEKSKTIFLIFATVLSCSSEKKETADSVGVSTVLPDSKHEITTILLKRQPFEHELISNGKVTARNMAELYFQSAEVIAHIWVKNGDRVVKGQKIAELDKFRLNNKLVQSKDQLEKAKLELQDVLIGQGYNLDVLDKVPEEVMKLAQVKSGYDQSKAQYELAGFEDKNATLIAPFDGLIANLTAKTYNLASVSEVFCMVIDARGMEVEFNVLESELSLIKNGDKVVVSPYATTSVYEGSICEINPYVDDKGMVKVKARVNGNNGLFTGMNVRISVRRSLGGQLVIPKSAVVLRSGKQVVFTLKEGKAMWNYIQTGLENALNYTVVDGLHEEDRVIVTGNINLAHESPVSAVESGELRVEN